MRIVLASGSPRRETLLHQIGLSFEVVPSSVAEVRLEAESPVALAERLAAAKARDVAARHSDALVVGADTIVVLGDRVLGKPGDEAQARKMLRDLSGRRHVVITGVAIVHAAGDKTLVEHESTTVWIRSLTDEQITRYVATGEPMDKAGAYAVQGLAAALVDRLEGCYFNVMGLPVACMVRMLEKLGVEVL